MVKHECLLCKSNKFYKISRNVRDSKDHSVIQCKKCSHVQLFPIPTQEDEKLFYDNNMQAKNVNYFGTIGDYRRKSLQDTERRVQIISNINLKNNRILEVGSGHGFFVEAMNKNFDIIGIEVSRERRRIARKITTAPILDINLLEEDPDIGKFHTIVMFHVLEHVVDPILFLKKLKNKLRSNGKLVVEVPNFDDYQLNFNQAYRKWHFQRAHIHYFTPKTLNYVLKKAGFRKTEIRGIQRYGIENMISWKAKGLPQMDNPSYELNNGYKWVDEIYKKYLQRKLICDTMISISH